jgi:hypothetical protein
LLYFQEKLWLCSIASSKNDLAENNILPGIHNISSLVKTKSSFPPNSGFISQKSIFLTFMKESRHVCKGGKETSEQCNVINMFHESA